MSKCNTDPKAPHGFDRNASHNEERYVCVCESWVSESKKYGIKVKFLDDEYLWVTEGDNKFQIRPKLFETREEAQDHAKIWGLGATVEEYNEPDNL